MCNYCGYEHGMIGDVVCPVKLPFAQPYNSRSVFTDTWPSVLEVTWPFDEVLYNTVSNPIDEKEEFLKILREVDRSSVYKNNPTYSCSKHYQNRP